VSKNQCLFKVFFKTGIIFSLLKNLKLALVSETGKDVYISEKGSVFASEEVTTATWEYVQDQSERRAFLLFFFDCQEGFHSGAGPTPRETPVHPSVWSLRKARPRLNLGMEGWES